MSTTEFILLISFIADPFLFFFNPFLTLLTALCGYYLIITSAGLQAFMAGFFFMWSWQG